MSAFARRYGSSPLHLLATLTCFALAGYAVLQAADGPRPVRMAVWFVGALIAHDLVLFPLYALADRTLTAALPSRRPRLPAGGVNYVRIPLLLCGLLLLMFFPLIFRRSEGAYGAASGLDQSPYLGNYLLVTGLVFGASALLLAVNLGRRRGRRAEPAPDLAPSV